MIHEILRTLAPGIAAVFALMTAMWAVQWATQNASWGDVGWTFSIGLLAGTCAFLAPGDPHRRALVAAMAGVWTVRLGGHLVARCLGDALEDGRYREFRKSWGSHLQLKFLVFFLVQAVSCVLLSAPFVFSTRNPAPSLHPLEFAGAAVFAIAVFGEGLADAQLRAFKRDPASHGKTCRAGLWRLSRHPNYFFEWLVWVAWATLATASPWGWIAWFCPAVMLFLLLKVSGIPATEAQSLRSKGNDYRDYQRTTSAFFPWWPKK